MNSFRHFFFLAPFVSLVAAGCGSPAGNQDKASSPSPADTTVIAEMDTTVVDYDNNIPVTRGYVIARDTVALRQAPSRLSKFMEKAGYGTPYEVIEDLGDWLAVWSKKRYPYSATDKGKKLMIIAARKIFIPKSAIGTAKDLKLFKEDIVVVSAVATGDNDPSYYESVHRLEDYLSFELITKQEYLQKKKSRVDPVVYDTLSYPKKGGKLVLPSAEKKNVFEDSPEDAEENYAAYAYRGHIPALQQFILEESAYESYEFTLIDMQTGERTASMIDFPHVSPDGRHIIALYANPYESSEDIELYRISGNKAERVVSLSFPHWMAESGEIFFARDGYLYLPVFYNAVFWTPEGQLSKPTQFLRIRIRNS